ncbi:MAG: DNA alkylation repair protein [Chloroflexi bacterium]|nr:DNA alkylation repair protein [Chloroflexota bacterium]
MSEIDIEQVAYRFALDGDPERAVAQKGYLKSDLDFFGLAVPVVRAAIRREARESPISERSVLLQKSVECFDYSFFEMQLFGVFLLDRYKKLLETEDLYVLVDIVRKCKTWALVDPLSRPGEELVDKGMPGVGPILDASSVDENFWVRRYSILVLMKGLVRDDEYWDRFVGYADSMIEEKEFFIRKVIGWTLREVSKVRPDPVAAYVRRHMKVISGVTFREAVKYLPELEQSELRAAYKAR